MAIYKIFPEKDATIYTAYPSMNTGRDEILEIANLDPSQEANSLEDVRRTLIKFSTFEISDLITNSVGDLNISASLKLYIAAATPIPLDYSIEAYPVSESFNMGTGKFLDSPQSTDGVAWGFRLQNGSPQWATSGFNQWVTGSFNSILGGGSWYTSSAVFTNVYTSQSFSYNDDNDVNIDVTDAVKAFYTASLGAPTSSGGIQNNGFILKLPSSIEYSTSYIGLKFFSVDTHTIYPPCLEIKWDDTIYSTGSMSTISQTPFVVTFKSNQFKYSQNSIQRFRLNVRPQFPTRTFQTSSVYLNNNYLPQSSFYQIRDLDTGEIIIDFDDTFTKISADNISSYFDVFMNGLQPERYYNVYIKTILDGSTFILNEGLTFKISL